MKKILTPLLFSFLFSTLLFPGVANSQQQVTVGTGTAISVFSPINRTNDYSVYEVIYLASDIATLGNITHLAFWRHDGTDTATIVSVDLYMRHSAQTQAVAGNFDTTGYTHVYSGPFPNELGTGWREVALDIPFMYNGTDNLEVLVTKGYQPAVAGPPVCVRWHYTNITPAPDRARRYYGDIPISSSTSLATIEYSANVRLTFDIGTGSVKIVPGSFGIFPNPANGELRIQHGSFDSELKIERIEIYNALGKKVYSRQIETNLKHEPALDISRLQPGLYFIKLKSEQGEHVAKFIKE